jgi:hypothetical protein
VISEDDKAVEYTMTVPILPIYNLLGPPGSFAIMKLSPFNVACDTELLAEEPKGTLALYK